jgi:subtilisin family serine protease
VDLGLTVLVGVNNTVLNFSTGPQDVRLHGTPVVAIAAATETGVGGVGIAPQANVKLISAFDPAVGGFNHHPAITTAIGHAGQGGVMLVELQDITGGPLEMNAAHQAEFLTATSLGVTVIEPAGNGTQDLDNFHDFAVVTCWTAATRTSLTAAQ